MTDQSTANRRGIYICVAAMASFACMDAMTTFMVQEYAPTQIMTIRYWVFFLCALAYVWKTVGLKNGFKSACPGWQFLRSGLLAFETVLMAIALGALGLAETHALFAVFPLMATGLAVLLLGERIGWRRRIALSIGFIGALIIIRPGFGVFQLSALIPLCAAAVFAIYHIVTRRVSRVDSFHTSFLFMAMIGALLTTPLGIAQWRSPTPEGWMYLGYMSILGMVGHGLLVKALEYAEASVLQPFNYFLLAWATLIGITILGEHVEWLNIVGAAIIVAAGLFTMFRERVVQGETEPQIADMPPMGDEQGEG